MVYFMVTMVTDISVSFTETQSYVLNFKGRVTQASVKNFQIVHDNDSKFIHVPLSQLINTYLSVHLRRVFSGILYKYKMDDCKIVYLRKCCQPRQIFIFIPKQT